MMHGSVNTAAVSTNARSRHFFGLDLLRLFAALIVTLNHFAIFSAARPDVGEPFAFPSLHFVSDFGWVGVEIFFVISGFVIPLTASGATATEFLKRRIVRVLPALWICTLLASLALIASGQPAKTLLVPLLHSMTISPIGPYIDGVIWTVVVEAAFYALIWGVLVCGRFDKLDRVAGCLGVLSAAFLTVYGITRLFGDIPRIAELSLALDRFTTRVLLLRHGVFFALGISVWIGYSFGYSVKRLLFIAGMVLFGVLEISFQYWFTADRPSSYMMPIPSLIWIISLLVLFASTVFAKQIEARLSHHRLLFVRLGLLTYPLYLNHYTLGRVGVFSLLSGGLSRWTTFLLAFAAIISSSWLVMIYLEPALQSALRKLLSGLSSSLTSRKAAKHGSP